MKKLFFLILSVYSIVGFSQQKTDAVLITNANTVINATAGQNTASRIGNDFLDLANSKRSVIPLSASGTNTYIAASAVVTSYSNGIFDIQFQNGNSGASTLNINSLGAINLQKLVSGSYAALVSGDIQNNQLLKVWYDQPNNTFQVFLGGGGTSITYGTGVQTALGVNIGSGGAPVLFNGAGGTPTSLSLVNATSLPLSAVTGLLPYANFSNGAGLSVVGRSTNSSGVQSDIVAGAYQILRSNPSGTSLGFGSIDLSQSAAVGSTILGVSNGGTGLSAVPTSPIPYGSILNQSTWASLTGYTDNTSGGVSVVSNKLRFQSGTNDVSKTLDYNYFTDLENWTQTINFVVNTKPTTSGMGIGLGINSYCNNASLEVWAVVDVSTGASSGKIYLKDASNTTKATSTNAMTFSTGDAIAFTFERRGHIMYASVVNNTTSSQTVQVEWVVNIYTDYTFTPNSGKFAIVNAIGSTGVSDVSSWTVSSNEIKNSSVMVIGDSKILGYQVSERSNTIVGLLRDVFYSVTSNCGSSERSEDILNRTTEILALAPKNVILAIGCNDVRSSVAIGTTESNISSFVSTLQAAGINVILLTPFREPSISLTTLAAWVRSTYPSNYIETYNVDARMIDADNVHLNDLGQLWVVSQILNSSVVGNIPRKSSSHSTPDHISAINTEPNSQIRFGMSPLPNHGGTITSIAITHALFMGGARYGSGGYIPFSTAASSIGASGGALYFSANASLTALTPFTPSTRLYIGSNGNIVSNSTATEAFRTTNAGSDVNAHFLIDPANSLTSGVSYAFETTNGNVINIGNGTRRIAVSAFNLTDKTTTANAETTSLSSYVKPAGGALQQRVVLMGKETTLTESSATAFARITLTAGQYTGGEITVVVQANDGTDFQSVTSRFAYSAVMKSTAVTAAIETAIQTTAVSSGTLTVTITAVDSGSGNLDFKANAVSSLTQTALQAQCYVTKNYLGNITAQ